MRSFAAIALFATLACANVICAQSPPAAHLAPGLEFPVVMRQKIEAGKTPVGTKIAAKLTVATLVNGVVIPQDAVLSGKVIESASKTATAPSRLAICLESAEWKNGSTPAALVLPSSICLTRWFYPFVLPPKQDFPGGMSDAAHASSQRMGGAPPYPTNTRDSPPYSRDNTNIDGNPAPGAPPNTSSAPHRELMKNLQSTQNGGVLTLVSVRSTIKFDKSTTYVFAADDLGANTAAP